MMTTVTATDASLLEQELKTALQALRKLRQLPERKRGADKMTGDFAVCDIESWLEALLKHVSSDGTYLAKAELDEILDNLVGASYHRTMMADEAEIGKDIRLRLGQPIANKDLAGAYVASHIIFSLAKYGESDDEDVTQ